MSETLVPRPFFNGGGPLIVGDALRFSAPEGSYRIDACDVGGSAKEVLTFVRFVARPDVERGR